jgi:hypothetical protein
MWSASFLYPGQFDQRCCPTSERWLKAAAQTNSILRHPLPGIFSKVAMMNFRRFAARSLNQAYGD